MTLKKSVRSDENHPDRRHVCERVRERERAPLGTNCTITYMYINIHMLWLFIKP